MRLRNAWRLGRVDAVDVDLNRIGVLQALRVVAVEAGQRRYYASAFRRAGFDRLVGLRFGGVLHLYLQHQVASPLQIETEVNILCEIRFELSDRPGKADDAEQADEHGRHNHNRFDHQIPLHDFCLSIKVLLLSIKLLLHFEPSVVARELTAERENWSFRLSGLTLTVIVSSSTAVMVPTIPPVVTTGRRFSDSEASPLPLLLLLHGHKQQKIKDDRDQNEGQRLHRDGLTGCSWRRKERKARVVY